ncbi:kelch motif family protein [Stylonychia lemnae]|uniref:Kelch motif family protein n=1 Tax=Stylonychia lemnae TaxID=5949 RepID=A0A078BB88_STYLE|nr:kelch motif family protein [Stylonychia lemnae]|eukprot:CDW91825.1 kelch motif family protein [Stylonychia lemnae]
MSTSIFECNICYTQYNESSHRPLITQCGHIYCEGCLLQCTFVKQYEDQTNGGSTEVKYEAKFYDENLQYYIKCPTCQKIHYTHPSKLPCVYSIIAYLPSNQPTSQIQNQLTNDASGNQQISRSSTGAVNNLNSNSSQNIIQKSGSKSGGNHGHKKQPKLLQPTTCLRHPDKKIKYICESDMAFLCSKCVIQHTGVGHVISEYSVDIEKIKHDFQDVHQKYQGILYDAVKSKQSYDGFDKKLNEMCNRQMNKLDLTFKSIQRTLDNKKKEFVRIIREFYCDQKSKLEFDRMKSGKFLQKVNQMQDEFDRIEKQIETISYEEFFRMMSEKSKELASLQETNQSLVKNSIMNEKSLTLALFIDQVKIADFGNIQYVKACEYKGKTHNKEGKSPNKENGNSTALTQQQVLDKQQEEINKQKIDRSKHWALDEKVSQKLNDIINKIHDHQPITTKNQSNKEVKDFKGNNLELYDQMKKIMNEPIDINLNHNLAGTNSNKNLSSTMNSHVNIIDQEKVVQRGASNHTPHYPGHQQLQLNHQHKSDNDVIVDTFTKPKIGGLMLNDYEKNATTNQTARRQTFVPQIRTDLASNKQIHKTHHVEKEDYSVLGGNQANLTNNIIINHNSNIPQHNGFSSITGGSMTHRPDNRYDRYGNQQENDYDYGPGGTAEKEYKKQSQANFKEDNQTYSKYLNPIKQHSHNQHQQQHLQFNQNLNLLQQSLDKQNETTNPFENGLRQSTQPVNLNDTEEQILQDLDNLDLLHQRKNHKGIKGGGGQLSSDDEQVLNNMIQEIQSKSQERKRIPTNTNTNPLNGAGVRIRVESAANQAINSYAGDNVMSNQRKQSGGNTGHHSKKTKKDHSKPHHKSRKLHNDRYENHQVTGSHKRNGSMQYEENLKGGVITRKGDQTTINQAQTNQDQYIDYQKSAIQQHASNQNKYL